MKMIFAVAVTAVVCVAGTYVVLSGGDNSDNDGTGATISVAGSTTIQPLMGLFQENYEKYTNVTLEVSAGGSSVGASSVINGTSNIGMLSRDLKQSEIDQGLVPTVIAKDGVAIIVGSNAGVTDLTMEQIAKIFSGEIKNWNEVGGTATPIAVTIREESSGTRDCFDTALRATYPAYAIPDNTNSVNSTNAMVTTVEANATSIGYISFGALSKLTAAKAVSVGGIVAEVANVINDTYPVKRDLILATKGTPSGTAADFINWILGPEGQRLAVKEGFIAIKPVTV